MQTVQVNRRKFIVTATFTAVSSMFAGAIPTGIARNEKPQLVMSVWSQSAFNSETARKTLLNFCAKEGITHLNQYFSFENTKADQSLRNTNALAALVPEIRKQGGTVNVLRESKEIFYAHNHERTLNELRAIIAFDKDLPQAAHLSGVKYDVEPYGTKEWKAGGKQRLKVVQDYLSFLQKAKTLL